MVKRTVKSKDQQNLWRIWLAAWVTLQEGSVALNMCPVQLLHCIVTAVLTGLYIYIYIYIYVCVCVCVCLSGFQGHQQVYISIHGSVSCWLSGSSTGLLYYNSSV